MVDSCIYVLHGYRLVLAAEQYIDLYPIYPTYPLFRRLLRDEPMARTALLHALYEETRRAGGLRILKICNTLLDAQKSGAWSWGRFAKRSITRLVEFTLNRAWELADSNTTHLPRALPIQDYTPDPHYPREVGGFTPRPEDSYLDYGSFLPRRLHTPNGVRAEVPRPL